MNLISDSESELVPWTPAWSTFIFARGIVSFDGGNYTLYEINKSVRTSNRLSTSLCDRPTNMKDMIKDFDFSWIPYYYNYCICYACCEAKNKTIPMPLHFKINDDYMPQYFKNISYGCYIYSVIASIMKGKKYKAFIMGGFVRDIMSGKKPNDVDIYIKVKSNIQKSDIICYIRFLINNLFVYYYGNDDDNRVKIDINSGYSNYYNATCKRFNITLNDLHIVSIDLNMYNMNDPSDTFEEKTNIDFIQNSLAFKMIFDDNSNIYRIVIYSEINNIKTLNLYNFKMKQYISKHTSKTLTSLTLMVMDKNFVNEFVSKKTGSKSHQLLDVENVTILDLLENANTNSHQLLAITEIANLITKFLGNEWLFAFTVISTICRPIPEMYACHYRCADRVLCNHSVMIDRCRKFKDRNFKLINMMSCCNRCHYNKDPLQCRPQIYIETKNTMVTPSMYRSALDLKSSQLNKSHIPRPLQYKKQQHICHKMCDHINKIKYLPKNHVYLTNKQINIIDSADHTQIHKLNKMLGFKCHNALSKMTFKKKNVYNSISISDDNIHSRNKYNKKKKSKVMDIDSDFNFN